MEQADGRATPGATVASAHTLAGIPEQGGSGGRVRGEHTHGNPEAAAVGPGGRPSGPGARSTSPAVGSRCQVPGASVAGGPGAAAAGRRHPGPALPEAGVTDAGRVGDEAVAADDVGVRVRRHSVRGQVLEALRAALVGGELVPGEVYSAPALGVRLGVSATPVREAMMQLALEGAVEVVPNRGFRVVERSRRELAELAEVRALIEVPVMLRLARTVPAEHWAGLRPLAEATAAAAARGDLAVYGEADRAFHRALLGLAGNEQLVAVADDLHRRSQWPLVSPPVTRRADLLADAAEHGALLDALEAGDLAVVESLVREHFTGAVD